MARYGTVLSRTMSVKSRHTLTQSRTIVDGAGQFLKTRKKKKRTLCTLVVGLMDGGCEPTDSGCWACRRHTAVVAQPPPPPQVDKNDVVHYHDRAVGMCATTACYDSPHFKSA